MLGDWDGFGDVFGVWDVGLRSRVSGVFAVRDRDGGREEKLASTVLSRVCKTSRIERTRRGTQE